MPAFIIANSFSGVKPKCETGLSLDQFTDISPLFLLTCSFSDSTLANILSPKSDACGTKFELNVDEVLFVGHPKLAYKKQDREFKVSDYGK